MIEHIAVHRGSHQKGRRRRDDGGGQRIVGQPRRQLGDTVGRCWRDYHYVGPLGQGQVLDAEVRMRVEGVGYHLTVGDAAECQRGDEASGAVAHHCVHERLFLHQLAGQVQGLVTGDAAGDSQDNVFIRQRSGHVVSPNLP